MKDRSLPAAQRISACLPGLVQDTGASSQRSREMNPIGTL